MQPFQNQFESVERHVLLAEFEAMQRGRSDANLARELRQRHLAAPRAEEAAQLGTKSRHPRSVRHRRSHIWDFRLEPPAFGM